MLESCDSETKKDVEVYSEEQKQMARLLWPLKDGTPVCLSVTDPMMRRKRRIPDPVLFITPSQAYGVDGGYLVFSLQGGGCEVLPLTDLNHTLLFRIGLSMNAARNIVMAIQRVLSAAQRSKK